MKLIIIFLSIWIYRLLTNLYCLHRIKFLSNKYDDFWKNKEISAREYTSEIKLIFKKADIKEEYVGHVQPLGLGQIQTGNVSVFDNMFVNDRRIVSIIFSNFDDAIGVYKRRIRENFNPLYWIDSLIYLPKKIFVYLGINEVSIITKIFQIIYWFVCAFYTLYNEQINKLIQDFLSNLFK